MGLGGEEALGPEREQRPRAGAAAIAAGALTLAGGIGSQLLYGSGPGTGRVDLVEALQSRLEQGRAAGPGLLARTIDYLGENLAIFLATGLALGIAALLYLLPLGLLFRAVRARNPTLPRLAAIFIVVGTVGTGVGLIAQNVFTAVEVADFAALPAAQQSSGGARDAVQSSSTQAAAIINLIGRFALGTGIVLVALNAMRVGLLTRFFGVLGILVGATVILPLDQIGLVRSFWFVALGLVLLNRWPGGEPPAWRTGRAEPWPSQQELRERRQALRERERQPRGTGADDQGADGRGSAPAAVSAGAAPPGSKKRRKRRR